MPALTGASLGIVLMLAAQVIMPVNDAIAKHLVSLMPVLMVAWSRFFFNALWLVPLVYARHGSALWKVERPLGQIMRGVVIVLANLSFVAGVRYVPLADALAIVFVAPLAVAALSAHFLGERVTKLQWLAVLTGFLGALVIIRPGFSSFSIATVLPLIAGLLFAVYLVLSRYLASTSRPEITLAVTATTGAVILTILLPLHWQTPEPMLWPVMALVGLLSGIGHLCITTAHVHAAASVLAPLTYVALLTATLVGYLWFGEFPDAVTWFGAAIVIMSGIVLWWSQSRAA